MVCGKLGHKLYKRQIDSLGLFSIIDRLELIRCGILAAS
jgi:hypothetical protein